MRAAAAILLIVGLLALLAVRARGQEATDAPPLDTTPELTPESSPDVTPEATAEATSEMTPEATGEPTVPPTLAPTVMPTVTPIPMFALTPGRSVEGNLTDAVPGLRYQFTVQAGDTITLRLEATSGTLDPFLTLFGPDGELVEQDDDDGGGRNAQIATTLPRAGTYVVEAARYSQNGATSAGTFRLSLDVAGQTGGAPNDPAATVPTFNVQPPPTVIGYRVPTASTIDDGAAGGSAAERYYAFRGEKGDLVRAIMSTTGGDLAPQLDMLNPALLSIASSEAQTRPTESTAYATLPETGWYLIRAGRRAGSGSFDLYVDRLLAGVVLAYGDQVTGEFTPGTPTVSYIVNARMGDQIAANVFATDERSGVSPELRLLDLNFRALASGSGSRFATMTTTIPRSGTYILQATNTNAATLNSAGGYNLRLTGVTVDVSKLNVTSLSYNEQRRGFIEADQPISYYRFAGKAGERVTIEMRTTSGSLDPYLILMSGDLSEELTFNDNVSATRNARIVRFRLDRDGDYLILASRAGLGAGATTGGFDLALTAGDIALVPGALSATLTWNTASDLNLFARDPNGRIVSWASPQVASGGRLQIDSNTGCQTPTDQPIEYIYWPDGTLIAGDYEIWAWYQATCAATATNAPVPFDLAVRAGSQPVLETAEAAPALQPGQRYVTRIRVSDDGRAFLLDNGQVTNPSAQQAASEGGDALIVYGDPVEAAISNDVYAHFYQFQGSEGERILIRAERLDGDLDPIVVLRDANDQTLPGGSNDDANPTTRDAALAYTLPESGTYIVAVTRFGARDGTTTGRFRLTLDRQP